MNSNSNTTDYLKMKRKIIQTLDGSTTIQIEEWNECYHSKHGAIQEAQHVFIKMDFLYFETSLFLYWKSDLEPV